MIVPCTPVPAMVENLLEFLVLIMVILLPPVSAMNKLPVYRWNGLIKHVNEVDEEILLILVCEEGGLLGCVDRVSYLRHLV